MSSIIAFWFSKKLLMVMRNYGNYFVVLCALLAALSSVNSVFNAIWSSVEKDWEKAYEWTVKDIFSINFKAALYANSISIEEVEITTFNSLSSDGFRKERHYHFDSKLTLSKVISYRKSNSNIYSSLVAYISTLFEIHLCIHKYF